MRNREVERSRHRGNRRHRPSLRPDLAGWSSRLEDRTLLSTITVNITNDQQDVANNATSVGSTVSLRDAVIVATNLSGATTIAVPGGLTT